MGVIGIRSSTVMFLTTIVGVKEEGQHVDVDRIMVIV